MSWWERKDDFIHICISIDKKTGESARPQKHAQQTFQRRFNVAFRLIWYRNVAQCQINVEKTLYVNFEIYNV